MKTFKKLSILFVLMFVCAFSVYAADYATVPDGEVAKTAISNVTVSAIAAQPYTGAAITPGVTIKYNDTALVEGTDYTLTYTNNTKIGTAKITIAGTGNYEGTKTVTFKILKNINSAKVSGVKTKTYTGSKQTQSITVKYRSKTLKKNTDYTVAYSNNVNAGTATVTITGKGSYAGTKKVTFKIARRSIAKFTFSKVKNYTYTGKAITPGVTVKYGKKTLTKNTDYTISYSKNVSVGTATITITGKGNYAGTKKITFKINKRSITAAAIAGLKSKTYTGSKQYQSLTLTYNGITLKKDTHYTLSYKKNVNAGVATVTITGKGNFTGSKTLKFKIWAIDINTLTVNAASSLAYTGNTRKPTVTVKDGSKTLKNGTDYTVKYSNNVKVGTAKITVTGKGNYTGTKTLTFKITKASIASATIKGLATKTYTGGKLTQSLKLTYAGHTLKNGTDYTLAYTNNVKAGTATVTITGKGNFSGTKALTFKIARRSIAKFTFSKVSNYAYTGKAITPGVTVKYGKTTLVKDTDYTVSYSKNVSVGTATMTITGKGNYAGTKKITFKINKRSIASATIAGLASKAYTGKNITQSLTLTYNGITLKNGTHYTLSYSNNKNIGIATVTITGKGNFKGSKTLKFKINPQVPTIATPVVTDNNVKVSWSKVSNATGYELYMSKSGAAYEKVATITKNSTLSYTVKNLEDGNYTFKVRAYKTVSKANYYSVYSSVVSCIITYATGPVDYIVGENIEVGTYRVTPIDTSRPVIAYEYFDMSEFEDFEGGQGGMGFAVYAISMNKGYITLTEEDIGVTVENGKLEKLDLANLEANIQTTLSDGMYLVGKDMAPGIYKVTANEEFAAVELSKNARVTWDKEFTYTDIQGGYIEIPEDCGFVNILDGTLTKVDEIPVDIKTTVSNGVYIVGKDIAPGTYKVTRTSGENYIWTNVETWSSLAIELDYYSTISNGYIEITEDICAINLLGTTIEKVDEFTTNIQTTISEDGTYIVGKDLTTGVYKYSMNDVEEYMVEIEKLKDLKMTYDSITASSSSNYGYFEVTDEDYAIKITGVTIEKVDFDNLPVDIKTTFNEGAYIVGKDIAPGVYKITKPEIEEYSDCYVGRYGEGYLSMDYSAQLGSVYINNGYLEVLDTDIAVVVESGNLTKVDIDNLPENIQTTISSDGTYIVGKDIAAGTYKMTSTNGIYAAVELLNSLDGSYSAVDSRIYLDGKLSYVEITEETYAINVDGANLEKFNMEEAEVNLQTTISEAGTYLVGIDIAPGVYKVEGAYVARYSSINTTYNYMLGSASYDYGYIEIKDTDVAITLSYGTITKVDVESLPVNIQTTLTSGAYIVGKDIAPGVYKITIDEDYTSSLVETYSSIDTVYENRTEYFLGGYGYIEVDETDYFVVIGYAATITKVDVDTMPADLKTSFDKEGIYIVGKDIAPGVYKVQSDERDIMNNIDTYVTTYSAINTDYENMLDSYSATYGYFEIKDTDYVVKLQTGTLTKVDLDNLPENIQTTVSSDGTYIVGKDIAPGTYKVTVLEGSTGYIARLSSIANIDVIESLNLEEATTIEIKETDVAIRMFGISIEKVEAEEEVATEEDTSDTEGTTETDTETTQTEVEEVTTQTQAEEVNIYDEVDIYSEN